MAISKKGTEKPPEGAAARGGRARAQALSPAQRSEIARWAAEAKWARKGRPPSPRATHDGVLTIGDLSIPCAVLEDGTRVLTETGIVRALGLYRSGAVHVRARDAGRGGAHLPLFVANKNLRPFVDRELENVLLAPIWFVPTGQGTRAKGVEASIIPRICEVWLQARDADALRGKRQILVAERADILIRALAHVGIIALVDEATGYQDDRARDALAQILEAFVAEELQKWMRTFPADFYKQMFRLKAKPFTGSVQRPRYFGHLTNNVVYERLAPGVLEELRRKNPADEAGRRRHKHFQWLTPDIGHPKLSEHIAAVVALMKVSSDWDDLTDKLDKALPKYISLPLFDGDDYA